MRDPHVASRSSQAALQTLFVGIGSPHGDDQIGWTIADMIAAHHADSVLVRKASIPSDLLDWLPGMQRLIIVDAVRCDAEATVGQFQCWNWPTPLICRVRSSHSHAFGLPQVLELADRLKLLPPTVLVLGINGQQFAPMSPMSEELQTRLPSLVTEVIAQYDTQ